VTAENRTTKLLRSAAEYFTVTHTTAQPFNGIVPVRRRGIVHKYLDIRHFEFPAELANCARFESHLTNVAMVFSGFSLRVDAA
jgi:hypothetical protein